MRRDRKTDVMTTKTVQKYLLLHGFLYCEYKLCKQNSEKQYYGNCFMVTVCAQKDLKHKQKLFRTTNLCKLNYVNNREIYVFT